MYACTLIITLINTNYIQVFEFYQKKKKKWKMLKIVFERDTRVRTLIITFYQKESEECWKLQVNGSNFSTCTKQTRISITCTSQWVYSRVYLNINNYNPSSKVLRIQHTSRHDSSILSTDQFGFSFFKFLEHCSV